MPRESGEKCRSLPTAPTPNFTPCFRKNQGGSVSLLAGGEILHKSTPQSCGQEESCTSRLQEIIFVLTKATSALRSRQKVRRRNHCSRSSPLPPRFFTNMPQLAPDPIRNVSAVPNGILPLKFGCTEISCRQPYDKQANVRRDAQVRSPSDSTRATG